MQVGNSKQVRKVINKLLNTEDVGHFGTWSDRGRGKNSTNSLNLAWAVGVKVVDILPKVNAALRAAGYSNVAKQTQHVYLRVQAPIGE